MKVCESVSRFSYVWLFEIPWTVACQAPLSMGFSRQEYWSGLPCPSSGDLPDPGVEPRSPALQQILYHLNHQGSPYTHILCLCNYLPMYLFLKFLYIIFSNLMAQCTAGTFYLEQQYCSGQSISPLSTLRQSLSISYLICIKTMQYL